MRAPRWEFLYGALVPSPCCKLAHGINDQLFLGIQIDIGPGTLVEVALARIFEARLARRPLLRPGERPLDR
jgi:hypothetical protein